MHLLGWGIDLDSRTEKAAGAARAPQSMVQEFLNRSDEHLWAVLSNGRQLRLLRDNTALVGQAYVEFDLETIFDGESFTDFALMWLVCQQSRLERLPGPADETGEPTEGAITDRWLERWRTHAIETGTRALAELRTQVTKAIEALGTGFLRHPGNDHLRDQLAAGEITSADLQRSLLRTVYRLLFWFVAEDRDALLDPAADDTARARYTDYYSSARLRRIARRRVGTRHTDLWQAARIVLDGLGHEDGRPELGLAGLGGLFEPSRSGRHRHRRPAQRRHPDRRPAAVHHPGEGRRPAAGRRLPQPRRRGTRLHLRGPARAAPPHRPGRAHVHPRRRPRATSARPPAPTTPPAP